MTDVWSSVGSAGAVDVADLSKVVLYNSIVQLGIGLAGVATAEAISAGTRAAFPVQGALTHATVRYGVAPTDAFTTDLNPIGLGLRYRDGDGYLVARFVQVNAATGAEYTLITFDSRNFPEITIERNIYKWHIQYSSDVRVLDIFNNAYYIELILSAVESPIRPLAYPPAVQILRLERSLTVPPQ